MLCAEATQERSPRGLVFGGRQRDAASDYLRENSGKKTNLGSCRIALKHGGTPIVYGIGRQYREKYLEVRQDILCVRMLQILGIDISPANLLPVFRAFREFPIQAF